MFSALIGHDIVKMDDMTQTVITRHQCITAIYENLSLEVRNIANIDVNALLQAALTQDIHPILRNAPQHCSKY